VILVMNSGRKIRDCGRMNGRVRDSGDFPYFQKCCSSPSEMLKSGDEGCLMKKIEVAGAARESPHVIPFPGKGGNSL
jgi:hypothetical protein